MMRQIACRPDLLYEWIPVLLVRPYWINSRTFQIHFSNCPHSPDVNDVYLGNFGSLQEAVDYADWEWPRADWCDYCLDREMDVYIDGQLGWLWCEVPVRFPAY